MILGPCYNVGIERGGKIKLLHSATDGGGLKRSMRKVMLLKWSMECPNFGLIPCAYPNATAKMTDTAGALCRSNISNDSKCI